MKKLVTVLFVFLLLTSCSEKTSTANQGANKAIRGCVYVEAENDGLYLISEYHYDNRYLSITQAPSYDEDLISLIQNPEMTDAYTERTKDTYQCKPGGSLTASMMHRTKIDDDLSHFKDIEEVLIDGMTVSINCIDLDNKEAESIRLTIPYVSFINELAIQTPDKELTDKKIVNATIVKNGSHQSVTEALDMYHDIPSYVKKMSTVKYEEENINLEISDGTFLLTIITDDNCKYSYGVFYDSNSDEYYLEDYQNSRQYINAEQVYRDLDSRFHS